jgi:hypothetical protein
VVPLSVASKEMHTYLSQSVNARKPVGYNREFLGAYRSNETFYLSKEQRAHLAKRWASQTLTIGQRALTQSKF